jgi:hypothetical protein
MMRIPDWLEPAQLVGLNRFDEEISRQRSNGQQQEAEGHLDTLYGRQRCDVGSRRFGCP